ncbi:hypothetical protein NDU88_005090, partial [Pleurodeles waltl]
YATFLGSLWVRPNICPVIRPLWDSNSPIHGRGLVTGRLSHRLLCQPGPATSYPRGTPESLERLTSDAEGVKISPEIEDGHQKAPSEKQEGTLPSRTEWKET